MKIGRNDPCPCGSGKKYKKCCLNKKVTPADELLYRRLNLAHDKLIDRLMRHGREVFGEEAIVEAFHEYCGWPEGAEDDYPDVVLEHQDALFVPWFLFNWEYEPDLDDPKSELPGPPDLTIAELYAEKQGRRLDTLERKFIDATNRKPYSFLEVVQTDPGKGFELHDLFRGTRHQVMERAGSQSVETGDILFGRVIRIDTVTMMLGMSAIAIPSQFRSEILALGDDIGIRPDEATEEDLFDGDFEIRQFYLEIHEELVAPPEVQNTDGDPLLFHTVRFEIDSAETAFERLCDLCATEDAADLLEMADLDKDGRIERVEIPWNRMGNEASPALPNTLLGRIVIDGRSLTVAVNSAPRADTARTLIQERLGSGARYKTTVIQDPDAWTPDDYDGEMEPAADTEFLMANPAVRQQITEFFNLVMHNSPVATACDRICHRAVLSWPQKAKGGQHDRIYNYRGFSQEPKRV